MTRGAARPFPIQARAPGPRPHLAGSTPLAVAQAIRKIESWKTQDSRDLYNIDKWGNGYYRINERGNVAVSPCAGDPRELDIKELVDSLQRRGLNLPILLRFPDVLHARMAEIRRAFERAREDNEYQGGYCCVYPIKVNQQRHLVQEFVEYASDMGFGIEAGSKPELLAVLALTARRPLPIVCNGFKDDEFIEVVVLASKMGRDITPIVEKFSELELIVKHARVHNTRPKIGIRVKLAARGAGRWEESAGVRSKFGLTLPEILRAVEYLRENDMLDCLQMLHFHMGSQISNIRSLKGALTEAARIFVELHRLGANMRCMDVGGGLGIDYDGSQTNFASSMNYTLQEYANDVVFRIKSVCDEAGVPHPLILSESGRALVSFNSLLVFNVLGVTQFDQVDNDIHVEDDAPEPLRVLDEILATQNAKNCIECYHDALQAREECTNLFNLGYLPLEQKARAENIFWRITNNTLRLSREMKHSPEELEGLETLLSDIYFCNFSVFQSMPDSWAISQLFPVMPIHRLNEEPSRKGVLADITCDSDGKIGQFIDLRDVKDTLELHPIGKGEPYYLGVFLIGAYQEILGDLHNLLGDTNTVHVSIDEDGEPIIEDVIKGDTVAEVLRYVQYDPSLLMSDVRRGVEEAVRGNRVTIEESTQYMQIFEGGLAGYTYLE